LPQCRWRDFCRQAIIFTFEGDMVMRDLAPRIISIVLGTIMLVVIFRMTLRKKSNEGNSMIWIIASLVLIINSFFPRILDWICVWVGVKYQPILPITVAIAFLIIFVFYLSITLSVSDSKIKELSIQISLLNNDIIEMKKQQEQGYLQEAQQENTNISSGT
jgi:hypothetical protein